MHPPIPPACASLNPPRTPADRCASFYHCGLAALGLWLVLFAIQPEAAVAQPTAEAVRAGSGHDEPVPAAVPARDAEHLGQERAVAIGFYLLFGIAFLGLVLLLWVIWWGVRLRQAVRKPLPRVSRNDELWYLKGGRGAPLRPSPGVPGRTGPAEDSLDSPSDSSSET